MVADRLARLLKQCSSPSMYVYETRAPMLDPGRGRTKTDWLWALANDNRAKGGPDPPAFFFFASGRGGEHAEQFRKGFDGILQIDGYAGYNRVTEPGRMAFDAKRLWEGRGGDQVRNPRMYSQLRQQAEHV